MGWTGVGENSPLSWEDFEKEVLNDISQAKAAKETAPEEDTAMHSDWIFRGQTDCTWGLQTAYERYLKAEFNIIENAYSAVKYYMFLESAVPAVNSLTSNQFSKARVSPEELSRYGSLPHYELICYARHHGFPTPLLDWSESYYIAAFFAFKNASQDNDVAIFSYKEWTGDARGGWLSNPLIDQLGNYVETHSRHYKQQSTYTVCRAERDGHHLFMNHEDAVRVNETDHHIKKFILKSSEKEKVLKKLQLMNINDYTLFGSEEALMRHLAYRESRKLWS